MASTLASQHTTGERQAALQCVNPVYIGLYLRSSFRADWGFMLRVGNPTDFPKFTSDKFRLTSLKRVPEMWQDALAGYIRANSRKRPLFGMLRGSSVPEIGYITYWIYDEKAVTGDYAPIKRLEDVGMPMKLSYFIEAMATHHLKTMGMTSVSTTCGPSESRQAQVRKVGLEVFENTDINAWLMAMGRGIRLGILQKPAEIPAAEHVSFMHRFASAIALPFRLGRKNDETQSP